MQTIASTYVRTSHGRAAAFNPISTLPQQLKTLLQAVDGKTASSLLHAQFSSLGNVTQWLGQLEAAGLIEDKTARGHSASYGQDTDEIWGAARGMHPKPALHIVASPQTSHSGMQRLLATPVTRADAWQPTAAAGLDDDVPSRSLETILADLTQQVVDVMATFVLTYLPDKAFEVLTELETLRSPAQLKATLPSYESLVRSAGQAGRQHIAELQQLMEQQFVAS
jgi:hypothetical protein